MVFLAVDWIGGLVQAGQFILSFSILVVLHEFGHYITAKWFKCRVEKFYLFFNPWFSLFKKKIGETEWGIGWIPFGGYVKIAGMVDESMDKEQMKLPPKPDEFRSKPAWQRLIIMVGGVVVNILLAIIIFIGISWVWGEEKIEGKDLKYGIVAENIGQMIGLQDGDIIYKIGNKIVDDASDRKIAGQIIMSDSKDISVIRNNDTIQLPITNEFLSALKKNKGNGLASIRIPFIIDTVMAKQGAANAGLQKNDYIIAVDNKPTPYFNDFQKVIVDYASKTVPFTVIRNNDTLQIPVTLNEYAKIGAGAKSLKDLGFNIEVKKYTLLEAIPVGYQQCWSSLGKYVEGIKRLFQGKDKVSDSLGSVISIGSIYSKVWDWQSFWVLTALFSIILAFMNILPIPALDGGHALFCIIEIITGKKPSDKFMEYAQTVGMLLLIGLMVYALGLDIWRWFR
ncbi:MAG: RIP metalloprotease RseP [Chitinophagales bacterium]|nr:RIP metalloprotease RseP [Chitinophagales bacterium]